MLGRAVGTAAAADQKPQRNDLAKQIFPSSSPAQDGNIQEQFKKSRQPSQSIGGFTGYTNTVSSTTMRPQSTGALTGYTTTASSASTLRPRSLNIRQGSKTKTSSFNAVPSRGSGLPKVLSREDSFQDQPDTIDLPDKNNDLAPSRILHPPPPPEFQIDENDFEDDDDIDLDQDFDLPTQPTAKKDMRLPPPYKLPPPRKISFSAARITSSAQTWSSSSPSHKLTPPAASKRSRPTTIDDLNDEKPRPSKRRSLPWLKQEADKEEIAAYEEEEDLVTCFRCHKKGHATSKCPEKKGKGKRDFTTLPKDKPEKSMPWNATGTALAEEKRKYKDKQKARKDNDPVNKLVVKVSPISLSQEQQRVLDLVANLSKSVFFTGSAGTGKSVLMRAIIADLRKKWSREPDRIAVTASTGLAACNIGGVTLHSFAGIGLGKEDIPTLVKKIKKNAKARNRWIRTRILVIDEISMVDGDLFDKLEGIARSLRNNGRPFGGIQLVITGDFFQLPPVPDYDNKTRGVKFAFDAGTWSTAIHHTIGLTEVFRQKDPVFANMLNEMRLGKITNETIVAFKRLSRQISYEDTLVATELFPTRQEVENSNEFRMRSLHGKLYNFEAQDTGTVTDIAMRDKLLSNMMAPKTLKLKKGAQVMLIKNMDDGLVNGSLGSVVGFMDEKTFEFYDKNPELYDTAVKGEETEELRSARSSLKGLAANAALPNSGAEFPLVRFSLPDGTTRDLLVTREEWKIELPSGEVQAQRNQLPLILAWALSIHKAQGQTLERVKIDLKKVFEKGQAYVALSRATSQDGLEVQNFDKNKVMAHPRVAQFYDSLYSVNKAQEHPQVTQAVLAKATEADLLGAKAKSNAKPSQAFGYDMDEEEIMAGWA